MLKTRKCIDLLTSHTTFESTKEDPDENCINCILDDILSIEEGETRDIWISFYREGRMMLNCARTGKSYIINKEFFNKIFNSN